MHRWAASNDEGCREGPARTLESDSPTHTGAPANPETSWDSLPSKRMPWAPTPAFPSPALPSLTVVPRNTGSSGASCVPRATRAATSRAWKQPTCTPKASLALRTKHLGELMWTLTRLPSFLSEHGMGIWGLWQLLESQAVTVTTPCPHTPAVRPHLT